MRKQLYWILILPLFVLTQSCEGLFGPDEEKRSLPPITNTGENTFGMKVNGQVWLPYVNQIIEMISIERLELRKDCGGDCLILTVIDDKVVGNLDKIKFYYSVQQDSIYPTDVIIELREPISKTKLKDRIIIDSNNIWNFYSTFHSSILDGDTVLSG